MVSLIILLILIILILLYYLIEYINTRTSLKVSSRIDNIKSNILSPFKYDSY